MQQDEKYKGMTVNERLYVSGLLDQFEKAVRAKNVESDLDPYKLDKLAIRIETFC